MTKAQWHPTQEEVPADEPHCYVMNDDGTMWWLFGDEDPGGHHSVMVHETTMGPVAMNTWETIVIKFAPGTYLHHMVAAIRKCDEEFGDHLQ